MKASKRVIWNLSHKADTREIYVSVEWPHDESVHKYHPDVVTVPVRLLVDGKPAGVTEVEVPFFVPAKATLYMFAPDTFRLPDGLAPGKHIVAVELIALGEKLPAPALESTV